MIKLIFCVRRRPGMTREAFHDYWFRNHGPLVKRHAATLGIKRYVQSHALHLPHDEAFRASRGAGEPYDGAAEIWIDSVADLDASAANPAAQAAGRELLEDEAKFIDLARSSLFLVEECVIVG